MKMEMKKANKAKAEINYGSVPPQSIESEKAVLGACMLDKRGFYEVAAILKPECFYSDKHQAVFQAMVNLSLRSEPIDSVTVLEELSSMGKLGDVVTAYELTMLTRDMISAGHIEAHARTVHQKWVLREIIRISYEAAGEAFEPETLTGNLLDQTQTKLFRLSHGLHKKDFVDMESNAMEAIQNVENKRNREPGQINGVPSGFRKLDACTGGFQETDLIILAARPSVGKTAFALNLARNAAKHPTQPVGVAFFSLEMSTNQLVNRIFSMESQIALEKIRDGDLNPVEMQSLFTWATQVATYPIYIDDTAAMNVLELKAKCKRLVENTAKTAAAKGLKKGIGLIIIDYLQLMNGVNDGIKRNKNDILTEISRELKILAKELQVPIIALSQMSRAIETRQDKEPVLSDLRECGAIEQDADIVAFLYNAVGDVIMKIAKHRNGKLKKLQYKGRLDTQKFEEADGFIQTQTPPPFSTTSKTDDFTEGIEPAENEFSFIKKNK